MTALLIAARINSERQKGLRLLTVLPANSQIPLGAIVVGEIPEVRPPKWWARARREAKKPASPRWLPPCERDRRRLYDFTASLPVREPLWSVWQ